MNIMTQAQAVALAELMKETEANTASVEQLPRAVVSVALYGDVTAVAVWRGTINYAGCAREWATVLA